MGSWQGWPTLAEWNCTWAELWTETDMQKMMAFNPLQLCAHSFHEVELDSMDSYALSDHQKHLSRIGGKSCWNAL